MKIIQLENTADYRIRLSLGSYTQRLEPGQTCRLSLDLAKKKDVNLLRMIERCPAVQDNHIIVTTLEE